MISDPQILSLSILIFSHSHQYIACIHFPESFKIFMLFSVYHTYMCKPNSFFQHQVKCHFLYVTLDSSSFKSALLPQHSQNSLDLSHYSVYPLLPLIKVGRCLSLPSLLMFKDANLFLFLLLTVYSTIHGTRLSNAVNCC